MWIAGDFDTKQIKCSSFARDEVQRLSLKAKTTRDESFFASDDYIYVSFLNARSLRKHNEDISEDDELMKSTVIGVAETHLHEDESVELQGFVGNYSVNAGKGKGTAAFSKVIPTSVVEIKKENFSAIFLTFEDVRIGFVYVSKGASVIEFETYIIHLLQDNHMPTIVIGDMNYHYLEDKHALKALFTKVGYIQMIDQVTHDEGHILDHIYISSQDVLSKQDIYLKPLYFSDHDAICLKMKKI